MTIANEQLTLPLLPLRDVVVYPHMVIPLFVGREKSINALEAAMQDDKKILLVAQKEAQHDEPNDDDIYHVGTVATILQLLKLPDGTVKVLVEGNERAEILSSTEADGYLTAQMQIIPEGEVSQAKADILMRTVKNQFEQYVKAGKKIPNDALTAVNGIDSASQLADTVAAHMALPLDKKQEILEIADTAQRLEFLIAFLENELDLFQVEKRIRGRVKKQMERSQREYYLNEQMKAIQKELGDIDSEAPTEMEALQKRISDAKMPKAAEEKALAELNKLKMMSPMSAEASVLRTYIDWMANVPWSKRSKVLLDMERARKILDEDHYGLEDVKERVLEFLAVQKRVKKLKGPILCLVGPPGVGKTSLGESIAKATNRKFVRMALGGVRDEAEIRGHRRTYIGSMPGKILQNMSKVGVRNPLFLLDEIDKMGADFRGDPSSALLEVLDPEQNHTFQDHYVEVDYDLSDVMFVATANTLNIPPALLDRMEVIRLSGYTEDEKTNIAMRYLIPKQMKNNGLKAGEIEITEAAVRDICRYYTREAGVRNLEREVSKICRKVVKALVLDKGQSKKIEVTADNLDKYLGVRQFSYGMAEKENQVGQVTGLAWTEVGGELLTIESAVMPGKGNIQRTGSIGDVMKESVEAARSVVRSRANRLGIKSELLEKSDLHIHFPEGAIPKDGPSAGIAITTALVSSLTGIPVRADVAMTGEITLRGEVLAIGGLKEKLLAAVRGGIATALIPEENVKDLAEIPETIKNSIEIIPVRWFDKVLEHTLERQPEPFEEAPASEVPPTSEVEATKALRAH